MHHCTFDAFGLRFGLLSDLLGLVWALLILSLSAGLGAIWTARVGMRALPGGMVRSRVGLQ